MDLWRMPRMIERTMYDAMREMDRMENRMLRYWRDDDHLMLPMANEFERLVDDDKKFAVYLNVSHFRPEELSVHLDGRELTIEGRQERKTSNSVTQRAFVRKWVVPEGAILEALRTRLDHKGHLSIEVPKASLGYKRHIPIMAASK